jgi:hypothetical protein
MWGSWWSENLEEQLEVLAENFTPRQIFPPHIPHGLTFDLNKNGKLI